MNAPLQTSPAVRTTCPYCGVGCGILAAPDASGGAAIKGDPAHPANFGRTCSKGAALGETLSLQGRLLHPMIRSADGVLERVAWTRAIDAVSDGFRRIIERDGPDSVAFYLSGQLLTEDYYVANKLMKGFIGSANIDTNSRLCMASSVAGHKRAFGADVVPGVYSDLDEADLIVLVGSNAAWCHPVLFQRMMANKADRGARIIVIDPRRTPTADEADLHLPIAPGTDTVLFSALLVHLAERGLVHRSYIDEHTTGFQSALTRAREIAADVPTVLRLCGLSEQDVSRLFKLFGETERVVTCFSQGVNQSAQGTDKVNAIINCHVATGRIGRPGMGPFSLTGQPNAMGGREVGGLANQLAAHMGFSRTEIDRVGRFWTAPRMATREGLKALDMFDAIGRGKIKALWVMATNPAVSLPRAAAVRDALKKLELFVVSENVISNDTTQAGAHILLPAAGWGEKQGTVTNSERRISRQRPFRPLPGEAKPDWWIVSAVAQRMGFAEAFSFASAADVFREHAALSAFENEGDRAFDIGALADISDSSFDALDPVQWPLRRGEAQQDGRLFANGAFFSTNGKAKFIAPERPSPKHSTSESYPFRLNTGRIRDQWHTMTRTGMSPRLAVHLPEPFVNIHPIDAEQAGVADGGFAKVTTEHGTCVLKVVIDDGQRRGSVFVPIHWSDATASSARVGDLVNADADLFSGQPEMKATPATVSPVSYRSRGFILARDALVLPVSTWWARATIEGGVGFLLATNDALDGWRQWAHASLDAGMELASYLDEPRGIFRLAAFIEGRLQFCMFIAPADAAPQWDQVRALFESEAIEPQQRRIFLSGKACDGMADAGPVVCACFAVGLNSIRDALISGAARSVEEIGALLKAGTNCGSCVPELKRMVSDVAPAKAV